VPLIVDGQTKCIWYGDSLSRNVELPPDLKRALHIWRAEHTISDFPVNALPITYQIDDYSCGPLAHNALEHHLFPEDIALVDADKVEAYRMVAFVGIVDFFTDMVSESNPVYMPVF
jgi:hypothetical protein